MGTEILKNGTNKTYYELINDNNGNIASIFTPTSLYNTLSPDSHSGNNSKRTHLLTYTHRGN